MEKAQLTGEMSELVRKSLSLSNTKIEIRPDSDFVKDLGMDSMGLVDFVMMIEDKYNVRIEDDEIKQIKTVENVVDLLNNKLG